MVKANQPTKPSSSKTPTKQAKLTFFHPNLIKSPPKGTSSSESSPSPQKHPSKPQYIINDAEKNTVVRYFPGFISRRKSRELYQKIRDETKWFQERMLMFGEWKEPTRKVMTAGDEGLVFKYQGQNQTAAPWTETLKEIKDLVEEALDYKFNFAVLNYYVDGDSGMGWHADDRGNMVDQSIIASISFGAERKFRLRPFHLTKGTGTEVMLSPGDLLTMEGDCQKHFKHCVPKQKTVKEGRINITFRVIG